MVEYIAAEAAAKLHADLEKSAGYEVVYGDYDWTLNAQEN